MSNRSKISILLSYWMGDSELFSLNMKSSASEEKEIDNGRDNFRIEQFEYFQYLGAMKWYWLSLGYFASNMHIAHCKCVSDTHTHKHTK